eukprot:NODE_34_length_31639_cov_0.254375.p2 type:complete len:572 gc:universal NODE_34_length_31639_cov_0.254375:21445-19730(-)
MLFDLTHENVTSCISDDFSYIHLLLMCGIFGIFQLQDPNGFRSNALKCSKSLRHRGPDWTGCVIVKDGIICHERLAINGVDSGAQPIVNDRIVLAVNGEIYNYKQLAIKYKITDKLTSDCHIILYLYLLKGIDFVHELDGMFSFILYDKLDSSVFAARDPIGITPLYFGWAYSDNNFLIASEMKAIHNYCDRIISFPPGHYYKNDEFVRYFNPSWQVASAANHKKDLKVLRDSLTNAVKKRLLCEVPFGVLLSGGLDSSLICSIVKRLLRDVNSLDGEYSDAVKSASVWNLHSFSVGLENSPDLKAAKKVADYLSTIHHEFTFTEQDGIDAISDVIYHLETYDVTTIRASTPMFLMSRKIKAHGIKMVLSGEGSDEIFGGYLYFHDAPNKVEFQQELINRVNDLHSADCLRANKSTMAWGLEARVPFLDKEFMDVAMLVDPEYKLCNKEMEKNLIRQAFDTPKDPYLPQDVLYRQKEQFSDGVGYNWIDSLKLHAEKKVSDTIFEQRHVRFPRDTPATKEAYYFRSIFVQHFPQASCCESVKLWVPREDWGCSADPSGRAQKGHDNKWITK